MRDEKLRAVVARSTFSSQNVQNTILRAEHFWNLLEVEMTKKCTRLWREAHVWKSICTKYTMLGALLGVVLFKKCTPLWCEAHLEVKMCKTHQFRTAFGS